MWITRVSINNPVFATMVMVALCVLGIFSYSKLGVEQMPDISFPGAWVEVLQGVAPGSQVLAARFDNLREGAKALIVAAKTAPVASAAASTPAMK